MENIADTQTRLEAFIRDYCAQPSINLAVDLSPGSVLSELLIKLSAQLHNELKNTAEVPSVISNVKAALDSTTDTYSASIDAIASNYNVTRDTGVIVTGKVKVSVAFARIYYIPNNFQLIQPSIGGVYKTTTTYKAASDLADSPSTGELKLYKESTSGPYYFLLPVSSPDAATGVSAPHNISMSLNLTNTSLDGFIEAKAFGNFSSGRQAETDRELIARFQGGLSARGLMSPQSMEALLPEVFPGLFTQGSGNRAILSIVGAMDRELNRGKNVILGVSQFGLADVYVRTSRSIQVDSFATKAVCVATPVGPTPAQWRITLDSTLNGFPTWFYKVNGVSYTDDNGDIHTVSPSSTIYGYDLTSSNQLGGNSVITSEDVARFTKYQTAAVTVVLPHVLGDVPSIDDTTDVNVTVSYMPNIGDIQDYILRSEHRVLGVDYLVKAVIPCSLSVHLSLQRASSKTVDTALIKQAIFNYVNGLSFGEPLVVSKFVDICHDFDIKRVDLPVVVSGTIIVPTANTSISQVHSVTASDLLNVPDMPSLVQYGVSGNTTAFFIDFEAADGTDTIGISLN